MPTPPLRPLLLPAWLLRVAGVALLAIAAVVPVQWVKWRTSRTPMPAAAPDEPLRPAMVLLPAGTFLMGSPNSEEGRDGDETQHRVTLTRPFLIARTEVTQQQYKLVMGDNPSLDKSCGSNCPVESVSWLDVVEFCNRLSEREGLANCYVLDGDKATWPDRLCAGYRLPTEAEWEYAARGGTQTVYVGTNDLREVCRYGNVADKTAKANNPGWSTFDCDDRAAGISKVDEYADNGYQLFGMGGNVGEWVWDWHDDLSEAAADDPVGPSSGVDRVLRGGSWVSDPRNARVAYRARGVPSGRRSLVGFRVARSLPSALLPSYPLPDAGAK